MQHPRHTQPRLNCSYQQQQLHRVVRLSCCQHLTRLRGHHDQHKNRNHPVHVHQHHDYRNVPIRGCSGTSHDSGRCKYDLPPLNASYPIHCSSSYCHHIHATVSPGIPTPAAPTAVTPPRLAGFSHTRNMYRIGWCSELGREHIVKVDTTHSTCEIAVTRVMTAHFEMTPSTDSQLLVTVVTVGVTVLLWGDHAQLSDARNG